MRTYLLITSLCAVVCLVLMGWLLGVQDSKLAFISFLVGYVILCLNLMALYFSWKGILEKKNLVLSAGVIVIKYTFLSLFLYQIVTTKLLDLKFFMLGLGMFLPASVIWAIKFKNLAGDS